MLVDGGYIKPEKLLETESAKEIREAINKLQEFKDLLEEEEITFEI